MTLFPKSGAVLLFVGLQVLPALPDAPPSFNVGSTCSSPGTSETSREACRAAERAAQSELKKTWSQYSARAKTVCAGVVSNGGAPSYVELITCLETMSASNSARNVERLEAAAPKAIEQSKAIEQKPVGPVEARASEMEVADPMTIHPPTSDTPRGLTAAAPPAPTPAPSYIPARSGGDNWLDTIVRSVTSIFGKR